MGSIGAISAAAVFVFLADKAQNYLIPILIAYATGTLLTAALYGLIPEAIEGAGGEPHGIMLFVLGSILFFFFLEKIIIWRNCPDETCDVHAAAGPIVLVGDAFHNLTDGIVIAAAFLTDFTIGIAVGFAILAHEIPQETGDMGILLNGGFSKKKSYLYNTISSITTIPSAIISYFILESVIIITPYILAISAASFLYIALSDLTPELHQRLGLKHSVRQLIFIIAGILTMLFIFMIAGHSH